MDDIDNAFWPRIRVPPFPIRVVPAVVGGAAALRHRLDRAAREHGRDGTEALVLDSIRRHPLCAPWHVRRQLGLPRSTLGSVLDRLDREDLLTRNPDPFTGQRFELRLTTAGELAADLADDVIGSLEEELAGYTSPEERVGAVSVFEACMALDRPDRPLR